MYESNCSTRNIKYFSRQFYFVYQLNGVYHGLRISTISSSIIVLFAHPFVIVAELRVAIIEHALRFIFFIIQIILRDCGYRRCFVTQRWSLGSISMGIPATMLIYTERRGTRFEKWIAKRKRDNQWLLTSWRNSSPEEILEFDQSLFLLFARVEWLLFGSRPRK